MAEEVANRISPTLQALNAWRGFIMGSILVFAPGTFHHGGNQVGLLLIGGVEVFPRQFVVGILPQMALTFSNKFVKGTQILPQRGIYRSIACGGLQSGNAKIRPIAGKGSE